MRPPHDDFYPGNYDNTYDNSNRAGGGYPPPTAPSYRTRGAPRRKPRSRSKRYQPPVETHISNPSNYQSYDESYAPPQTYFPPPRSRGRSRKPTHSLGRHQIPANYDDEPNYEVESHSYRTPSETDRDRYYSKRKHIPEDSYDYKSKRRHASSRSHSPPPINSYSTYNDRYPYNTSPRDPSESNKYKDNRYDEQGYYRGTNDNHSDGYNYPSDSGSDRSTASDNDYEGTSQARNQEDLFSDIAAKNANKKHEENVNKAQREDLFRKNEEPVSQMAPISFKNFKAPTKEDSDNSQLMIQEDITKLGQLIAMNIENNETLKKLEEEEEEIRQKSSSTNASHSSPKKPVLSFKNRTINLKAQSTSSTPESIEKPLEKSNKQTASNKNHENKEDTLTKSPPKNGVDSNSKDISPDKGTDTTSEKNLNDDFSKNSPKANESLTSKVETTSDNIASPKVDNSSSTPSSAKTTADSKVSANNTLLDKTNANVSDENTNASTDGISSHSTNNDTSLKMEPVSDSESVSSANAEMKTVDSHTDTVTKETEKDISLDTTKTQLGEKENPTPVPVPTLNGNQGENPQTNISEGSSIKTENETVSTPKALTPTLKSSLKHTLNDVEGIDSTKSPSHKKVKFTDTVDVDSGKTETIADRSDVTEPAVIPSDTQNESISGTKSQAPEKATEESTEQDVQEEEMKIDIKKEEDESSKSSTPEPNVTNDREGTTSTPEPSKQLVLAGERSTASEDSSQLVLHGERSLTPSRDESSVDYEMYRGDTELSPSYERANRAKEVPKRLLDQFFADNNSLKNSDKNRVNVIRKFNFAGWSLHTRSLKNLNIFKFDHTMIATVMPNKELYHPNTYENLLSRRETHMNWYNIAVPEIEGEKYRAGRLHPCKVASEEEEMDLQVIPPSDAKSLYFKWSALMLKIAKEKTMEKDSTNMLIIDRHFYNNDTFKDDIRILNKNGIRFHLILSCRNGQRNQIYYNIFREIYFAEETWCQRVQNVEIYDWERKQFHFKDKKFNKQETDISFQVYQTPKHQSFMQYPVAELKHVYTAFHEKSKPPLKVTRSITYTGFRMTLKGIEILHDYLLHKNFLPNDKRGGDFEYNWAYIFISAAQLSRNERESLEKWKQFNSRLMSYGKIEDNIYAVKLMVNTENTRWLYKEPIMIIAKNVKEIPRTLVGNKIHDIEWVEADLDANLELKLVIRATCKVEPPFST